MISKRTMKNVMSSIKVICIQFLASIFFFFFIDLIYTKFFLPDITNQYTNNEQQYRIEHKNFHHTLAPSYRGLARWGDVEYEVCTDPNGFKAACKDINNKQIAFDVAFIGDSFTEAIGMEYQDSFVGMYANKNPNMAIANLGVSSYSPSVYFTKISWLLKQGYHFNHVYAFIDISDVQDESNYFRNDSGDLLIASEQDDNDHSSISVKEIKAFIQENFYIFTIGYFYVKSIFADDEKKLYRELFNFERSAWTYNLNSTGYGELGAKGYIEKSLAEMRALHNLLDSNGIKLSVGVYPWPAQLVEMKDNDSENAQSIIWSQFCEQRCERFVDLFPIYQLLVDRYGVDAVYDKYFIRGDVHYNIDGNKLIYSEITKSGT